MLIAGPCSYIDKQDENKILKTFELLKEKVDIFRCKIWLGGTRPDRYVMGYGDERLSILSRLNKIIPVITEVHIPEHIYKCSDMGLKNLWIGARNSQNYSLLEKIAPFDGRVFVKRGAGMTIDETIGLYDIMHKIYNHRIYIIERGINTFDRLETSRWSPDLKGVIRIKIERPDIFEKLVVDCSHSVGMCEFIPDTYNAFKSIGVKHFMFECTDDGKSRTDQRQMLSVDNLYRILGEL